MPENQKCHFSRTDPFTLDGYAYGYNQLGQRVSIGRDIGITASTVNLQYDSVGQLKQWSASEANGTPRLNEQLGYDYDAAGNLQQRTNNTLVQAFSADAANQLTGITRSGTLTVSGNTPAPASIVTVNGQPAFTYADFTFASSNGVALSDGLNAFTNIAKNYYGTTSATNGFTANLPASVTLQYDANGNLTNDGFKTFGYDEENQLTNVTATGQWREDYRYDGLGRRRITRQYAWAGSDWSLTNETRYLYSGSAVIQERDGNNVAQVSYTRGISGLMARTDTNGSVYYHADGNGNVTALQDANQYIVGRYLYDAFGRTLGQWGPMADINHHRFASKEYDGLTGLSYFGHRFYSPGLQRFINRDPIGEAGGANLYGYCRNNPVTLVDRKGFAPIMTSASFDLNTGQSVAGYSNPNYFLWRTPTAPGDATALIAGAGLIAIALSAGTATPIVAAMVADIGVTATVGVVAESSYVGVGIGAGVGATASGTVAYATGKPLAPAIVEGAVLGSFTGGAGAFFRPFVSTGGLLTINAGSGAVAGFAGNSAGQWVEYEQDNKQYNLNQAFTATGWGAGANLLLDGIFVNSLESQIVKDFGQEFAESPWYIALQQTMVNYPLDLADDYGQDQLMKALGLEELPDELKPCETK